MAPATGLPVESTTVPVSEPSSLGAVAGGVVEGAAREKAAGMAAEMVRARRAVRRVLLWVMGQLLFFAKESDTCSEKSNALGQGKLQRGAKKVELRLSWGREGGGIRRAERRIIYWPVAVGA